MAKDKKEKKQKAKTDKKPKTKKQKTVIAIGIVFAVLFILSIGTTLAIGSNSPFYESYVYLIMPKSIETEFDGKEMTFYVEKNNYFKVKD